MLSSPSSIIIVRLPFLFEDSLTLKDQSCFSPSFGSSTKKLAKNCAFIKTMTLKFSLNSDNLTDHDVILPSSFNFCNTCLVRSWVHTMILKLQK